VCVIWTHYYVFCNGLLHKNVMSLVWQAVVLLIDNGFFQVCVIWTHYYVLCKWAVIQECDQPSTTARVNQSPRLHQLAVLSIGWAGWFVSFSFVSLPYVNQHSTTVNLFWLLSFDHLIFRCQIFPTLTSILPTHLANLLT
jgi:hypothetical protein